MRVHVQYAKTFEGVWKNDAEQDEVADRRRNEFLNIIRYEKYHTHT